MFEKIHRIVYDGMSWKLFDLHKEIFKMENECYMRMLYEKLETRMSTWAMAQDILH